MGIKITLIKCVLYKKVVHKIYIQTETLAFLYSTLTQSLNITMTQTKLTPLSSTTRLTNCSTAAYSITSTASECLSYSLWFCRLIAVVPCALWFCIWSSGGHANTLAYELCNFVVFDRPQCQIKYMKI